MTVYTVGVMLCCCRKIIVKSSRWLQASRKKSNRCWKN